MERVIPVDSEGVLCDVCYYNYNEIDMYGLTCKHLFCKNCVTEYLEFNITNG